MTEPIPQWKRIQELEAENAELKLTIVRLKNEAYITQHGQPKNTDSVLMTNPDDIARLTVESKRWHNYNKTFTHKNGTIYSYDEPLVTYDNETGELKNVSTSTRKTDKARQKQIIASFTKFYS